MSAIERVAGAARRLKVFPLPNAVLFPGSVLPLHIFEARYRQMVEDALSTNSVFAMARPRGELEPPPIEPVLCAGVIGGHERLADGRYNLVLTGVVRARVLREWPLTRLYREVEAEVLPDAPYDGPRTEQLRQAVVSLAAMLPEAAADWVSQVAAAKDAGLLADLVAGAVVADHRRRAKLLETLDVPRRLELVLDDVGALLARLGAQAGSGGYKN